jgi:hypothetical protein
VLRSIPPKNRPEIEGNLLFILRHPHWPPSGAAAQGNRMKFANHDERWFAKFMQLP